MSTPLGAAGLRTPPLSPTELLQYVRFVADEVRSGQYLVGFDSARRWHQRLYRDRRVDLWLISWLPSQGTELHDHGGSAGAFAVLAGTLTETIVEPGGLPALHERRWRTGAGLAFGPRHVHDVGNPTDEPAVSVHAYSPPLTTMNFFDLDTAGSLRRLASVPTDDPEQVRPGAVGETAAA